MRCGMRGALAPDFSSCLGEEKNLAWLEGGDPLSCFL